MNTPLVEVSNISFTYHEKQGETQAIRDLSFTVNRGEFVSIVGPSGCGKTSVLSMLAGLLTPSQGTIRIAGKTPEGPTSGIGYMLQRDHLLDWRTIEGNIHLGLQVKKMLNDQTRAYALHLLETYGLKQFRTHYPQQLSGGMRQKVALIRTLAFSPDLLLLDEPFSALDYQTRLRVADEIYEIIRREHKTAILVTHDIAEAISMSDRILVFSQRPATLAAEHKIRIASDLSPLTRRNAPAFQDYFNTIWKELDCHET